MTAHADAQTFVQLSLIGLEQPVAGLKLVCQHEVALLAYGTQHVDLNLSATAHNRSHDLHMGAIPGVKDALLTLV